MTDLKPPHVFLSHAHSDKAVARRLRRRLAAHGIKVWLDERELSRGTELSAALRSHVEQVDVLLVVASIASATSPWVMQEIGFAHEHRKPILPLFIEPVMKHERFRATLGIEATRPPTFAARVELLIRDLYLAKDREPPPADPAILTSGLRELAREQPVLAPLIEGCLDSEGLHAQNTRTANSASFHALDEAIDAIFDLQQNETAAFHAAYAFQSAGAGARSLGRWIAKTGDGGIPLVIAVGNGNLDPSLFPAAMELLATCSPPSNQALATFIEKHGGQLDETQRRSAIALVTWPLRDVSNLGDVLGWAAMKRYPDSPDIRNMWIRWIESGQFDSRPDLLARHMANATSQQLVGWEPIGEALRGRVRSGLRSADRRRVIIATYHIMAAADSGSPMLRLLLAEAEGVSGTAEWDQWRTHDQLTAHRMAPYVNEVVTQARGTRDWSVSLGMLVD
jgi:hypothetical protein